ncbi:MAG: hypothetical protein PHW54_01115 [Candidatus Omnitrophica bacterium]|nr:hypothetical protein [Candidatus Omnitrophota bacterium]
MQITWSVFHETYSESEVKKYAPKEAGVYLLWVKLKSGEWRCFYVGLAEDLEIRLLDHLSDNEENECVKEKVSEYVCGFQYAKVSKQDYRNGIEKYLYDHYSPECNQADPGGESMEVNLP